MTPSLSRHILLQNKCRPTKITNSHSVEKTIQRQISSSQQQHTVHVQHFTFLYFNTHISTHVSLHTSKTINLAMWKTSGMCRQGIWWWGVTGNKIRRSTRINRSRRRKRNKTKRRKRNKNKNNNSNKSIQRIYNTFEKSPPPSSLSIFSSSSSCSCTILLPFH